MNNNFNIPNFIIIEKEILLDKRLTDKEKIVYSLICSLANNNKKCCYARNKYLCELSNLKMRQLQNILNHLKKLKYINIDYINYKRVIIPVINQFLIERDSFEIFNNASWLD